MLAPPKPPHEEPEALIPEARERQRRRRLLVAASVASVAGLVLLVHALFAGPGANGTSAGSAGVSAPACRSSQLSFSAFSLGMGMNGLETQMRLTDTGSRACALPAGLPTATVTLNGKPLPARQRLMAPPYDLFGRRAERILEPGRKYYYVLVFGNVGCHRDTAAYQPTGNATAALRFSDGLRLSAQETTPENNGYPIVPLCGEFALSPLLRVP